MLKIGKTYRLAGRNVDVDIVASAVTDTGEDFHDAYKGQFFVGIARNDVGGDWVACYKPDGTRLWGEPPHVEVTYFDLVIPPRLIDLNDATKQIRALAERLDISKDAAETVIEALEKLAP